jgi:ribosome recycling factor
MEQQVNTEEIMADATAKMEKAVQHAMDEFAILRTGRAAPILVERLTVDYYGTEVPLHSIAGISVADPRTLVISPYDRSSVGAVEKAIRDSDLGVNPTSDGVVLRVTLQPPTEERRKELIKTARAKAEEGRVAIRASRRAARHALESLQRQGEITEDDLVEFDKDLERLTGRYVRELDAALQVKERDLLEV